MTLQYGLELDPIQRKYIGFDEILETKFPPNKLFGLVCNYCINIPVIRHPPDGILIRTIFWNTQSQLIFIKCHVHFINGYIITWILHQIFMLLIKWKNGGLNKTIAPFTPSPTLILNERADQ